MGDSPWNFVSLGPELELAFGGFGGFLESPVFTYLAS